MKKGLALLFVFILCIQACFSQMPNKTSISDFLNESSETKDIFNSTFSSEVNLPGWMKNLSGILFQESEVKLADFVIFSELFIILLVIIYDALLLILNSKKQVCFVISLLICVLIGISGGIKYGLTSILFIFSFIPILNRFYALRKIFAVVLIAIAGYIIIRVFSYFEKRNRPDFGEEGRRAGFMAKMLSRLFRDTAEKK